MGGREERDFGGTPRLRGSRLALCLWLPAFELRLELLRSPELDSTSVALLTGAGGARREIWQVSERAGEAGVRPGMRVGQAVGLCPGLTLLEPDPAHYDAAVEAMLEALQEVSPIVEPAGRGRIFVGVDGLDRLHGPPPRQVDAALSALSGILPHPLVAAVRVGRAPGKFGAWVAAAGARPGRPVLVPEDALPSFLAPRPVEALPVDPLLVERLRRLGIGTLGDLAALPEAAVTAQFGREGRRALAWARGERIDPVHPWRRPDPVTASLEFPSPVGRREVLHGALDRLVERALGRPARRGRSVRAVRLRARLEGGGSWAVEAVLREPTSSRERIASPLRAKLAVSPPGRAVEALTVEFFEFGAAASQPTLFDRGEEGGRARGGGEPAEERAPRALREAVRELRLKFGHSPLYRVVEVDPWSRIPERRHALLAYEP